MNPTNPMSQMATASKLSIQQLQQALRNGTIDPLIGQTVLRQKIKQAEDMKQSAAAQQPAQPPVAQQNMTYGQGVETLPSNLPAQGMAQGGIVAFAEGGEADDSGAAYNEAINKSFLGQGLGALGSAGKLVSDYMPSITNLVKTGGGKLIDKATGLVWVRNPYTGELVRASDVVHNPNAGKLADTGPMAPQSQVPSLMAGQGNAGNESLAGLLPTNQIAQAGVTPGAQQPAGNKNVDFNAILGGNTSGGGGYRARGGAGGASPNGYKVTPYDTTEVKQMLAEAKGEPHTYEEVAAQNKQQGIAAGVDYDLYKKQMAELEGKKARPESRSKLDEAMPWFAAAKAFGESKPWEGLGTMAARALSDYGTTKADLSDKEEARLEGIRRESNQLGLAQNAFNQAVLSGNKHDLEAASNKIDSIRLKLTDYGVKSTDQQNEAAKVAAQLRNQWGIAQMQEAGAWGRANKEGNTIAGIAAVIQKEHPEMPKDEVMRQAYLIKSAGSVYGADQRDVANRRTAINAELKTMQFAFTPEMKQRKAQLQAELDSLGGAGTAAPAANPYEGFSKIK